MFLSDVFHSKVVDNQCKLFQPCVMFPKAGYQFALSVVCIRVCLIVFQGVCLLIILIAADCTCLAWLWCRCCHPVLPLFWAYICHRLCPGCHSISSEWIQVGAKVSWGKSWRCPSSWSVRLLWRWCCWRASWPQAFLWWRWQLHPDSCFYLLWQWIIFDWVQPFLVVLCMQIAPTPTYVTSCFCTFGTLCW